MLTADEVANWMLLRADRLTAAGDDEEPDLGLSNLKLQKLLYYAQGHHLGKLGTPLFLDKVQAWAHGPVVGRVYFRFKRYGKESIDPTDSSLDVSMPVVSSDDTELLESVWATYSPFTAWTLRERTHAEDPWREAYDPSVRHVEITQEAMRRFFESDYKYPAMSRHTPPLAQRAMREFLRQQRAGV